MTCDLHEYDGDDVCPTCEGAPKQDLDALALSKLTGESHSACVRLLDHVERVVGTRPVLPKYVATDGDFAARRAARKARLK